MNVATLIHPKNINFTDRRKEVHAQVRAAGQEYRWIWWKQGQQNIRRWSLEGNQQRGRAKLLLPIRNC